MRSLTTQLLHAGRASSHLICRRLHSQQPFRDLRWARRSFVADDVFGGVVIVMVFAMLLAVLAVLAVEPPGPGLWPEPGRSGLDSEPEERGDMMQAGR